VSFICKLTSCSKSTKYRKMCSFTLSIFSQLSLDAIYFGVSLFWFL